MSIVGVLDNLLIQPLMLLCDSLFNVVNSVTGSPGWTLIILGIVVNVLLLPVYYQMEKSGRAARLRRAAMDKEVARIKDNFTGRERYFYIRTIHRHYGYRPFMALFGAGDLILQVVVFATVYRYLSNLTLLDGVGFIGIPDLSRPDGMLLGINVLPLVMTAANIASVFMYVDDVSKRRQGFLLAALFLVLLYASPSGLVLYWTSSNIFSWVRNFVGRKLVHKIPATLRSELSQFAHQE